VTEVTAEIGGSATGPSGKLGIKGVNETAGKVEPAGEFTAAYAYEPSCHLLADLPPSGYRPVSMVLLRDRVITQMYDPSGMELGEWSLPWCMSPPAFQG
jgi:hypothetical protein